MTEALEPLDTNLSRYNEIFERYREATMVEHLQFIDNLRLVNEALKKPLLANGAILECGTWRGGMAAAMIHLGGTRRIYHFFDSFQGLPPAEEIDGEEALRWQQETAGPRFFDNCTASRDEFDRTLDIATNPPPNVHVHEGWFHDTFPDATTGPVAILRLDADWFASTMLCLDTFWPRLLPGALVIIDDYPTWVGCRRAVHAFLAKTNAEEALGATCPGGVVYLIKS